MSDTVSDNVYYRDGFYYIPQQSGAVRHLGLKLVTFCYHPNTMDEESFNRLDEFLDEYSDMFLSLDDVELQQRPLSMKDRALRMAYFGRKMLTSWIGRK